MKLSGLTDLFRALAEEGLLVHTTDDAGTHLRKRESLLNRASSEPPTEAFLSKYDALMRLVEAIVVKEGMEFGNSPHLAMKRIIRHIDSEISRPELDLVVSERHKAKKSGVRPSADAMNLLDSWNKKLAVVADSLMD